MRGFRRVVASLGPLAVTTTSRGGQNSATTATSISPTTAGASTAGKSILPTTSASIAPTTTQPLAVEVVASPDHTAPGARVTLTVEIRWPGPSRAKPSPSATAGRHWHGGRGRHLSAARQFRARRGTEHVGATTGPHTPRPSGGRSS